MSEECTCGWLLSRQGRCCNPNHGQVLVEAAARRALVFLRDFHADNQRDVIEDLAAALGEW